MKRESGKRKRMLVCTATTVRSSSLLRVGRRHKSCIQTLGVQCLRRCRCHCRAWCDVCGVVWCMSCIVPQRRGTSIQSVVSGFLGLRRKKVVSDSLGRDRREKKLGGKESTPVKTSSDLVWEFPVKSGIFMAMSEIFWKQIRPVQVGWAHFMSEILCHSGTRLDVHMNYIFAIGAALDTYAYTCVLRTV